MLLMAAKQSILLALGSALVLSGCGNLPIHIQERKATPSPSGNTAKSNQATPPIPTPTFTSGMNVLIYGHPWLGYSDILFKRLRTIGITSVSLAFPVFQADWNTNDVYTTSNTPTPSELATVIQSAHAHGLSVMLRPVLDEASFKPSGHWRGTIQPTDEAAWFNSYAMLLKSYATLAQDNHVESLDIGSEFITLEANSAAWIQIVKGLRSVYHGKLAYSFDWSSAYRIPTSGFVPALDFVGIDAYYPLNAPAGATPVELRTAWQRWVSGVQAASKVKPIVFTEAGCLPVTGAYQKPWLWTFPVNTLDWHAQANYYQATYDVWHSKIKGIYWWGVNLWESKPGIRSFSPLDTPTENVIRSFK